MVKEYSLAKDGNTKLAMNFFAYEFACKDGSDKILIDDALVGILQKIRDHFGAPVKITSAYRTAAHNARVGGSPGSQHLQGTAADIAVKGASPLAVAQYAEYLMPGSGGIGVYGTFTHVDVRASRSRWDQRSGKQVVVGGWPGYQGPEPEPIVDPTPAETVPVELLCRCGGLIATVEGVRLNGAVYVPVRALGEALGHTVEWTGGKVTVK